MIRNKLFVFWVCVGFDEKRQRFLVKGSGDVYLGKTDFSVFVLVFFVFRCATTKSMSYHTVSYEWASGSLRTHSHAWLLCGHPGTCAGSGSKPATASATIRYPIGSIVPCQARGKSVVTCEHVRNSSSCGITPGTNKGRASYDTSSRDFSRSERPIKT